MSQPHADRDARQSDDSPWARPGGLVTPGGYPSYPTSPPPQPAVISGARSTGRGLVAGIALVALGVAGGVGIVEVAHPGGSSRVAAGTTAPTGTGSIFGTPGGDTGPDGSGTSAGGSGSDGSDSSGSGAGTSGVDAAAVARNVDPGIVDITTVVAGGEAAGTGMVLTADGEVLTNNHVITGAQKISVRDVGNGRTYGATVVGYDRTHDVAVLKLTAATGLTTVKTQSTAPSVGAAVVGVGNAGGTGGTPSYAGGTVTATGQSITASDASDGTSEQLTGLLQTNAAIEPGDSGGPLVNASGQVVGMDTAASSSYSLRGRDESQSGSASQGFAIPIQTALTIAGQISSGAASTTVHIGSTGQLGVYVTASQDGLGEGAAGIVAGDEITSVGGTTVTSPDDLAAAISSDKPGQTVAVTVTTADGTSRRYSVTLGTGTPQ